MVGNYGLYGTSGKTRALPRSVIVDIAGGGDFTSVKSACDYVSGLVDSLKGTTPDGFNHQPLGFEIVIQPGAYAEEPFTVPSGVILRGNTYPQSGNGMNGAEGVRLLPAYQLTNKPFITSNGFLLLENLFISGNFSASATGDLSLIAGSSVLTIANCRISASNYSPTYQMCAISSSSIIYIALSSIAAWGVSGGTSPWAVWWSPLSNFASVIRFCWINASKGIKHSGSTGTLYLFMSRLCSDLGAPLSPDIEVSGGGKVYVSVSNVANYSGNVIFNDTYVGSNSQGTRQAHSNSVTPMIAKGTSGQTGNLFEAQDNTGAVKFAIEPDGDIRTARSEAGSTLGSVVKKLPIYDAAGNLLGYIPIYDAIT